MHATIFISNNVGIAPWRPIKTDFFFQFFYSRHSGLKYSHFQFFQALVVQKMDSAIHRINRYPVDTY